jgi:hypothetical protein
MESIIFHKYRDTWVFSAEARTPSGLSLAVEPVYKAIHDDAKAMREHIIQLLKAEPRTVPEPDYDDPEFKRTIFAKAFGLKSYQQYLKGARCIYLRSSPAEIVIEEWPRARGGFLADNPLWKKVLPADEFEGAVRFLINKTRKADTTVGSRTGQSGEKTSGTS